MTIILLGCGNTQAATVFYLHGKIVEDKGDRAAHPEYGIYEYGDIVSSLKDGGHTVISEVRKPDTDRALYAETVANQIQMLMDDGIRATEIVVIGFSKGAQIAALVSQKLANKDLRFVFQAVCGSWVEYHDGLQVYGDILSIYETSDAAGSCKNLLKNNPARSCELSISTGLRHGAFYQPHDAWFTPLKDWITDRSCPQSSAKRNNVSNRVIPLV